MKNYIILDETLDREWVDLILQALDSGLTVEEIRSFLNQTEPLKSKVM